MKRHKGKGERAGKSMRERERIRAKEEEEVWGGEQIDYRLEQMAQQVREERNFSFTASHIPFIFWQRDPCACGRVLTPAL